MQESRHTTVEVAIPVLMIGKALPTSSIRSGNGVTIASLSLSSYPPSHATEVVPMNCGRSLITVVVVPVYSRPTASYPWKKNTRICKNEFSAPANRHVATGGGSDRHLSLCQSHSDNVVLSMPMSPVALRGGPWPIF